MYQTDESRKFHHEITAGFIRSRLVNLAEIDTYLSKGLDGGRNAKGMELAKFVVRVCISEERCVTSLEMSSTLDQLGKICSRLASAPGMEPDAALQKLVADARNVTEAAPLGASALGKDDKGRGKKTKGSNSVSSLKDDHSVLPHGLREQVSALFDSWVRMCGTSAGGDTAAQTSFVAQLQQKGYLNGDEAAENFFRALTELAIEGTTLVDEGGSAVPEPFAMVDSFTALVVVIVKFYASEQSGRSNLTRINLLNKVFSVVVRALFRDHELRATEVKAGGGGSGGFNQRGYFRLLMNLLVDLNAPDPGLEAWNYQLLTAFSNTFHALQPARLPGFAFAWLELVSHRMFMPKLLLAPKQKGWPLFQRFLIDLFKFMEPALRSAALTEPIRLLYRGSLRVLLVLLHDFPQFLAHYHFALCNVIPPTCIQMRNLILSAFPRNMRLPDPFTPNLKVDLLPEINQSPRVLSDYTSAISAAGLKAGLDSFLASRAPISFLRDLKQKLQLSPDDQVRRGGTYNDYAINGLVLYVGVQAVAQNSAGGAVSPVTQSAPMDIFLQLTQDLDSEGRYYFLNAIANQLRYPNNHTHYFSCVLLYLFA
eukprot:SAG11_NODE_3383_length_2483_cov_1.276846_2_plen_594_part_01